MLREVIRGFAQLTLRGEVTRTDLLMLADCYEEDKQDRKAIWIRLLSSMKWNARGGGLDYDYAESNCPLDHIMNTYERVDTCDLVEEDLLEALK